MKCWIFVLIGSDDAITSYWTLEKSTDFVLRRAYEVLCNDSLPMNKLSEFTRKPSLSKSKINEWQK